ncbi:MAG: hypothetical protein HYV28_13930, partial [Ignavibacteriales bacterium]|nr:hypothetical protein [Ignavibacteriales bacterium]
IFVFPQIDETIAQGARFEEPLTMQGLDRNSNHSVFSKALGGTTIGMKNDVSVMFSNPAALQSLNKLQITAGNTYWMRNESQKQQYGPAKYYANFSLVMEGLTYLIPNTVLDTADDNTARDSVQRPYDNIGPNWSRKKNNNLPTQIMAAIPFTLGDYKIVGGIGAVEYANMNYYFQDNNVLSPTINIQRPYPVKLVLSDSNWLPVQWYQNIRSREGSIYGYGAAFSCNITENFSLGLSGMLINGSTDDYESQLGRGKFVFYASYFRLDSVDYKKTKTGTSDYSGAEFNLSGLYKAGNLTVGFSVKPPTTVTRDFTYSFRNDSLGAALTGSVSGSDKIKIPWRGSIGLSVSVIENLRAALEYELRPMDKAEFTAVSNTSNPWKSSQILHVGAEYAPMDWLTILAGFSDQAQVFEQEGNPFPGEPVYSTIISAGLGFSYQDCKLKLAYEYNNLKYNDLLQDAVFLNNAKSHYVSAEFTYNINLSQLQ